MAETVQKTSLGDFKSIFLVFVLSLALAIIIIDTTLLNVSLGPIIRDLNTNIQSLQWVITAYSLTLAALTITGGRIGDLFGRKKMFILGAVIFAIGSFIASISQNIPTMIIGESIIEGVGAALMMPATASLLVANFKGRARAIAFGIWGGVAGASSAIGPIIGGFMATNYSWRWGFRINVFVAAVLVIGAFVISDSRDTEEKPTLDFVGVLLSALGLFIFVFGIIESSTYGWFVAKTPLVVFGQTWHVFDNFSFVPVAIIWGLVILGLFLAWEQHMANLGKTPLVSMKLFKNRQFTTGVLTTGIMMLGMTGIIFSMPVFFQAVKGYNSLQTGFGLMPMSLMLLIVGPLGAFLTGKIKAKLLINIGLFVNVIGLLILWSTLSVNATVWSLSPGLLIFGIGIGLVFSQINNLTLSAVSVQEAGEASGVSNTFRQIGSTFGSSIVGAVLLGSLVTNLASGVNSSTNIPLALKQKIAQTVSTQTSNIEFRGGAQFQGKLDPHVAAEIMTISKTATVDANRQALLVSLFFMIIGFLISFTIPNISHMEKGESVAVGKVSA
jgi:EmrB/QacA subfamily drug resistance transporter